MEWVGGRFPAACDDDSPLLPTPPPLRPPEGCFRGGGVGVVRGIRAQGQPREAPTPHLGVVLQALGCARLQGVQVRWEGQGHILQSDGGHLS